MEFIVPGICGLLVILGLVAVIMSRSNWSVPQMILVFFVLATSLVFFFLAARTLRTRANWAAEVNDFKRLIKQVHDGVPDTTDVNQMGLAKLAEDRGQLKHKLFDEMVERGRVWPGAAKDRVSATGDLSVSFEQPPAGLDDKSVVFVFEQDGPESKKPGLYLGEFTVSGKPEKFAKLTPSGSLVQSELNDISKSKGPYILYEIMPADSHALVTDQLAADPNFLKNLPEASRDEYKRDQKPAKFDWAKAVANEKQPEGNDPDQAVRVHVKFLQAWDQKPAAPAGAQKAPVAPMPPAGAVAAVPPAEAGGNDAAAKPTEEKSFKPGDVAYLDVPTGLDLIKQKIVEPDKSDPENFLIYSRPLRDYARLFREANRQRNRLFAESAERTQQVQQMESALAQLNVDIKESEAQKQGLESDLSRFKAELTAVVTYNKSLDEKLTKTRATLSELFRANLRLTAQLAEAEKRAYEAIRSKSPPAETSASLGR
jgi:hypothetical protein